MKQRPGIAIAAVRLVFILSLCVLLYSVFQILKAPAEARQALDEWEKRGRKPFSPLSRRMKRPCRQKWWLSPGNKEHQAGVCQRGGYRGDLLSGAGTKSRNS